MLVVEKQPGGKDQQWTAAWSAPQERWRRGGGGLCMNGRDTVAYKERDQWADSHENAGRKVIG